MFVGTIPFNHISESISSDEETHGVSLFLFMLLIFSNLFSFSQPLITFLCVCLFV